MPVVTAARHGGRLACVTAAANLGLFVLHDDSVHVGVGAHGRAHAHDGCACRPHWDGVPAAGAFDPPTARHVLRQILGCRGVESFFATLESALSQRMITVADLEWLTTHTNGQAREAIAFARADADSGIESLIRWRMRRGEFRCAQVVIPAEGR